MLSVDTFPGFDHPLRTPGERCQTVAGPCAAGSCTGAARFPEHQVGAGVIDSSVQHDTSDSSGGGERAEPLSARLTQALCDAIVRGELAPGSKLSEPELARRHGASRGPLREALRQLEARKLVHWEARVGARVTTLSLAQLDEIHAVREQLEALACRLAATHMSMAAIDALDRLLDEHGRRTEIVEGQSYFQREGDLDFHFRIIDGSGNRLIRQILCEDLYQLMRLYRHHTSTVPGRPRRALDEHRRIVAALRERDAEVAGLMMQRHIRAARELMQTRADTLFRSPSLPNDPTDSNRQPEE